MTFIYFLALPYNILCLLGIISFLNFFVVVYLIGCVIFYDVYCILYIYLSNYISKFYNTNLCSKKYNNRLRKSLIILGNVWYTIKNRILTLSVSLFWILRYSFLPFFFFLTCLLVLLTSRPCSHFTGLIVDLTTSFIIGLTIGDAISKALEVAVGLSEGILWNNLISFLGYYITK